MNKSNKIKNFYCLEFKDKIQEEIFIKIQNMKAEEEINYFNNRAKQGFFKEMISNNKNPRTMQCFK